MCDPINMKINWNHPKRTKWNLINKSIELKRTEILKECQTESNLNVDVFYVNAMLIPMAMQSHLADYEVNACLGGMIAQEMAKNCHWRIELSLRKCGTFKILSQYDGEFEYK